MRLLLLVIAFILLIGVVLVATGVIHLSRDEGGNVTVQTPKVTIDRAGGNGSVTIGTDVTVGTTTTNVQVPVPTVTTNSQ